MAIRVFRCRSCGHRIRFGASFCGRCWTPTAVINRSWFYAGLAAVMPLGALVGFILTHPRP